MALFVIPIAKFGSDPSSALTVTSPAPSVYLVTINSPPDNRLTTPVCQALLLALDILEFDHPRGVVITTSAIPKFYSNGLDLEHAITTPGFWSDSIYRLWERLLTYPMPTLALIPGHAFAGGFITAMHHDYRVQNPGKGFLCLNEVDLGAPLKSPMSSIFRQKCSPTIYRNIVLEGKRFGGQAALESGLVDTLGGLEEALRLVEARNLVQKGQSGVYGVLKLEMWRDSIALLSKENYDAEEEKWNRRADREAEREEAGQKAVAEWKAAATAGTVKL
ncbi:enoyl-CoA hydratase/isomerase family protein [Dactylonectria macrodidyma]|uniref:Enoyl-CoA hydratase/isomerase family protein n=1 Tax=Dactylonectria macrodidyma TaxID=307937 RepID=A0A9P9FLR3_9HYPO|nr:enoyl-CoA hydratase/isomerase family protein [Dactylonectria macrodidyma]